VDIISAAEQHDVGCLNMNIMNHYTELHTKLVTAQSSATTERLGNARVIYHQLSSTCTCCALGSPCRTILVATAVALTEQHSSYFL